MVKYRRNDRIETANMGSEVGMLDINTGKYYVLDSIGTDLWNILEESKSFEDIILNITEIYDVSKERCKSDIKVLLREMIKNNILVEE